MDSIRSINVQELLDEAEQTAVLLRKEEIDDTAASPPSGEPHAASGILATVDKTPSSIGIV